MAAERSSTQNSRGLVQVPLRGGGRSGLKTWQFYVRASIRRGTPFRLSAIGVTAALRYAASFGSH